MKTDSLKIFLLSDIQLLFFFCFIMASFELTANEYESLLPSFISQSIKKGNQSFFKTSQIHIFIIYMLVVPNIFKVAFFRNILYHQCLLFTDLRVTEHHIVHFTWETDSLPPFSKIPFCTCLIIMSILH